MTENESTPEVVCVQAIENYIILETSHRYLTCTKLLNSSLKNISKRFKQNDSKCVLASLKFFFHTAYFTILSQIKLLKVQISPEMKSSRTVSCSSFLFPAIYLFRNRHYYQLCKHFINNLTKLFCPCLVSTLSLPINKP